MKIRNRKKRLLWLLISLCILMMSTLTAQAAATNLSMKKGTKKEVNVSLSYTQASHGVGLGYFVWTSTDPKVADVYGFSPKGTITAKGNGTCYIYANCYSPAPGAFGAWKVTVSGSGSSSSGSTSSKKKVTVKSIKLSKTSLTLNTGKSKTLKYTVSPKKAKTTVTWKSSNTSVASVSGGKVTAKKPGKATITVTTANGKKKSCKVTVKAPAKKVTISNTSVKLGKGDKFKLTATPEPYNTTDKLKWSTSNKKIATVSSNGTVTAKKGGKVTITVKCGSKKTECKITVAKAGVKKITPVKESLTINKGKTAALKYKLLPSGSDGTLTWSSNNTGVAKVNQQGKVTGVNAGTATVTVKASSGASCKFKVKVVIPASSVRISKSSVQIEKGKKIQLAASAAPSNATDKISWSSSNSRVAAVSSSGTVTGVKAGTAYIYAKAGSCTAKCTVTVKDKAENVSSGSTALTKIQISGNTNSMICGTSQTLDCYAYYGSEKIYVSRSKVSWTSSNAAVAEVSSSGKVTAKKQGRVTITASYKGKTASFSLEVKMSDGVDISKGYIRIYNGYYEQWTDKGEIRADYNPEEGLRIVQSSSETYDINIEADAKLVLEGVQIYAIRCYEDNVNIVIQQGSKTVNHILNGITILGSASNLTICGNGTLYTTTYGTALRGDKVYVQQGEVIASTTSQYGKAIRITGGLTIADGAHVTDRWNIKEGYVPDEEEQALIAAGKLTWEHN